VPRHGCENHRHGQQDIEWTLVNGDYKAINVADMA
jgi:hypothetical protein